jgi:esterase/lipase superfamily enzyme
MEDVAAGASGAHDRSRHEGGTVYIISYRANFWDSSLAAGHDEIRDVVLPANGTETSVGDDAFSEFLFHKRLLVLVHGYHNTKGNVLGGYCMIEKEMQQVGLVGPGAPYDAVVGLTWPGGFTAPSYPLAKLWADAISGKVWARLRRVIGFAESVDVMTHSLGARVILKALQNAAEGTAGPRDLFLTAPAVDHDSIERGEKFFSCTERCGRVFVLFSRHDDTLRVAYPIGEAASGNLFARALGAKGAEDPSKLGPNVHQIDCQNFVDDHSDYRKRTELYDFIRDVRNGSLPASPLPGTGAAVPATICS